MASPIPLVGDARGRCGGDAGYVPTTREGTRPARTFWWDRARPVDADVRPLRAVIFDMDGAMADIERDGHRVAFNAAFEAHGLDIVWDADTYGQLLRIPGNQDRIAEVLRRRGLGRSSDDLAAKIDSTKTEWLEDCILDSVVEPRPGLIDLVMSLFVAGIWVGVVCNRRRELVEPLVRQLVGDGLVETIVTGDDLAQPARGAEFYKLALWEFGITADSALAVVSSESGLHAAVEAGLATAVVPTDYTAGQDFTGAAGVRPSYEGAEPLLAASCERLHRHWWKGRTHLAVQALPAYI